MSFSTLPSGADAAAIRPFKLNTPQSVLDDLSSRVKNSKLAVPTFENTQSDGKHGVDRKWMETIKEKWAQFDWY